MNGSQVIAKFTDFFREHKADINREVRFVVAYGTGELVCAMTEIRRAPNGQTVVVLRRVVT